MYRGQPPYGNGTVMNNSLEYRTMMMRLAGNGATENTAVASIIAICTAVTCQGMLAVNVIYHWFADTIITTSAARVVHR
ncbi:hypothetical protein BW13_09280 [Bifidobacterium sp. UTCIF-37]|nr:hypothetical protein BW13_09280 [Bifidobacterium sp. UTCIF-37]TPF88012.1 hypothetical protein BW11_09035 [Bifidobacterium sp. UTCIF-38]